MISQRLQIAAYVVRIKYPTLHPLGLLRATPSKITPAPDIEGRMDRSRA